MPGHGPLPVPGLAGGRARAASRRVALIVMPGIGGGELAELLIRLNPGLKVILSSGYPVDAVVPLMPTETHVSFIQKPFLAGDLAAKVRATLDG